MPHRDLEHRTFQFACDVAALCEYLSQCGPVTRQLSRQLLGAATSIGANYEEAIAAQTRRDFASKCAISMKEARETRYWLRLIAISDRAVQSRVAPLVVEAGELVAIFGAVERNARTHRERG